MHNIYFFNSLGRKKEEFIPINNEEVKLYVCGPTVYDRPHLGNLRSAVTYDVLFRMLKLFFSKVTYVRNITDIDDKIIEKLKTTNLSIEEFISNNIALYHRDLNYLNCLKPTFEPRVTQHIDIICKLIKKLIEKGVAYIVEGNVLFSTKKFQEYGKLSKRDLSQMIAGARVEVACYKKDNFDFLLWKKVPPSQFGFQSPFGFGRPGWHIECSAMSTFLLGNSFDIHGGGIDLLFPHHENEIAQCEAINGNCYAKYWIHNGFLTVEGEKMSKSRGNFLTLNNINDIKGVVLRYFYLTTHYRKPLDFNPQILLNCKKNIESFEKILYLLTIDEILLIEDKFNDKNQNNKALTLLSISSMEVVRILINDLNTPKFLSLLLQKIKEVQNKEDIYQIIYCYLIVGISAVEIKQQNYNINSQEVEILAAQRNIAKINLNWQHADQLREQIKEKGYLIEDTSNGYRLKKINN